jgi:hypothetical protein
VKEVLEQLKAVAKGDLKTPDTVKRKFGNIIFAAVRLTPSDILGVLGKVRTECADAFKNVYFIYAVKYYMFAGICPSC